jgi:capsular exopolysaccharide synthesis family protein
MSRIHDALKKVEQEKAGVRQPETASNRAETTALPGEERSGTVENPLASSWRPRWNLDPKLKQLFNSHNNVLGTEELRTLRSRLYQIRDRQPLLSVLITSTLPQEGKSFLAAGLSLAIARQHERRVLIVDADLRRSRLHEYLGAPLSPGLAEYLSGKVDESSVIQQGPQDNLFLIPAGQRAVNPAELLANGRLGVLLGRLTPLFDWVVLDSPPALLVSDASVIAKVCDGVLLVVEAGRSPLDMVEKARDEFSEKVVLGVVLNRMEPSAAYQSYLYKYYEPGVKTAPDEG